MMMQGDTMTKPVVLVVDDEEVCISSTRRVLERAGAQVIAARSVVGALEALKLGPVDLILSDFNMPGGSGLQLFAALDKAHRARFVLYSGNPDACDRHERKGGRVLRKPQGSQKLGDLVRSLGAP